MQVAEALGTEIISADSRQVYEGIPIITAAPTDDDLRRVPHHLVRCLPLDAYFSASAFEQQALKLLPDIFNRCENHAVVCGGSMMYVDALCNGIDDIPTISDAVRRRVARFTAEQGAEALAAWLSCLDPKYYAEADLKNTKRLMHAVEICLQAGVPYSSLRCGAKANRDFSILKFLITAPREVLFDRINRRVVRMLNQGMVQEAEKVYPYRNCNSLNTVGFKEMFRYLDGEWDLPTAVARLQKNTRVYAKKQLTWYARDPQIKPIDITTTESPARQILSIIRASKQK